MPFSWRKLAVMDKSFLACAYLAKSGVITKIKERNGFWLTKKIDLIIKILGFCT